MTLIGITVAVGGFITERSNYNNLVQSPGGNLKAKEASLEKAIDIKPGEEAAYIALIQAYAEDGKFTEEESARFFSIYNRKKSSVPKDVNYDIGEAYLSYYTGESDSSARAKILTAEPFFTASRGGTETEKAESYIYLAECYRTFVMSDDSLLAKEISKEDLEKLLTSGSEAVGSSDNEKLRAIVSEAVLNLIEIEKIDMRDAGISEAEITKAIDKIGKGADLKTEALAEQTKSSVHTSYTSARKKEGGDLTYEAEPEEGEDVR